MNEPWLLRLVRKTPPAMRDAALLLLVTLSFSSAYADDKPTSNDKPKGHLVDPWARMPHPRDGMKLPDPRKAAEKATADGVVAPVSTSAPPTPEPESSTAPAEEPTTDPGIAAMIDATPAVVAPVAPAPTSFQTTKGTVAESAPLSNHAGLTLEAAGGFGAIYVADRSRLVSSPGGVGGLDLGVGGWLGDSAALTLRLAGSSTSTQAGVVVAAFLGPSLQLWLGKETWFGFGLGLATFGVDAVDDRNDFSLGGAGVDLRIGRTVYAKGNHTINGSIELTPSSVKQDFGDGLRVQASVASFGLLLGWQYL